MEIVVSGTRGGYDILHAKDRELARRVLLDIRAVSINSEAIGQSTYAVRFVNGKSIFSKYHIVRDVLGDSRTGFIGFSLFMDTNERLSGENIIKLLDKVSDTYFEKYISNHNLGNANEQWSFIDDVVTEYNAKASFGHSTPLQSGEAYDAYLYVKGKEDLKKYFDEPLQQKYTEFRQVLFVDESLKGSSANILNAIRHSNTELTNIDTRTSYTIAPPPTVNGISISLEPSVNQIREENYLKITYSKPCYKDVVKEFTWTGAYSDFIEINEKDRELIIKPIIPKDPITKTFTIVASGFNLPRNSSPKISYKKKYGNEPEQVTEKFIEFEGEELNETWEIICENDSLKGKKDIIPNNIKGHTIDIPLTKIVTFYINDTKGQPLTNVDIKLKGDDGEPVNYKKEHTNKFQVEIKPNVRYTITSKKYKDVEFSNNGGEFTLKNKKSIFKIVSIAIATAVVSLFVYFLLDGGGVELIQEWLSDTDKKTTTEKVTRTREHSNKNAQEKLREKIEKYINGDELLLSKLQEYQKSCEVFTDSVWKKEIITKIRKAREKREQINKLIVSKQEFEKAKGFYYSENQKPFKEVIDKIEYKKLKKNKKKLDSINEMPLSKIVEVLEDIVNPKEKKVESKIPKDTDKKNKKPKSTKKKSAEKPKNTVKKAETKPAPKDNFISEVQSTLKNKVESSVLKGYLNDPKIPNDIKASVKLYLRFWEFDGKGTDPNKINTYNQLLKKVKKDKYLKKSKLRDALEKLKKSGKYGRMDKTKAF